MATKSNVASTLLLVWTGPYATRLLHAVMDTELFTQVSETSRTACYSAGTAQWIRDGWVCDHRLCLYFPPPLPFSNRRKRPRKARMSDSAVWLGRNTLCLNFSRYWSKRYYTLKLSGTGSLNSVIKDFISRKVPDLQIEILYTRLIMMFIRCTFSSSESSYLRIIFHEFWGRYNSPWPKKNYVLSPLHYSNRMYGRHPYTKLRYFV